MKTFIVALVFVAVLVAPLLGADDPTRQDESKVGFSHQPKTTLGTPQATLSNINRISAWYNSNGEQERDPATGNSGVTFPRGTATAIYSTGLLWGGVFNDGRTPALRVNGQSYNNGTKPGRILGIRTGIAEDPAAPDVRIWRIRRDYATANLAQDAAEVYRVAIGSVTQAMIDSVRSQYARDWIEWPWQKGAPFYDVNNNGVKDSGEDPGLAGADQVLWYVCNDIGVSQPWACPESGIEEQTTIWAYNRTVGALADVIFKRFRVFYKGIASTPANARIDSMYLCQWSDPDIGAYSDDFAGCDSSRGLGYSYNANAIDVMYAQFGLPPLAVGYDFLQGPIVFTGNPSDTAIFNFRKIAGAKNRPLTTFIYFAAGGPYFYPPFSYSGAIQWYQMLRGFPPTPQGPPDPPRHINPATGQPTSFWLSGDPVAGTGWRDGTLNAPGDRQIVLSSGPFSLAVGDSQEIVVALVAGLGGSNINSITVLRSNVTFAQTFHDSLSGLLTSVDGDLPELPGLFLLHPNYPNPFNPSTRISYQIPRASFVILKVYDVLGREVATLVNQELNPGIYEVSWNAVGFPSGVYFCRLAAGDYVETRKLVLLK